MVNIFQILKYQISFKGLVWSLWHSEWDPPYGTKGIDPHLGALWKKIYNQIDITRRILDGFQNFRQKWTDLIKRFILSY